MKKLTELLLTGVLTLGCGGEKEGKTELVGCGPGQVSGFDQYTGEKICILSQGNDNNDYTPSDYDSSEPIEEGCEDHVLIGMMGYNVWGCRIGFVEPGDPETCTIRERVLVDDSNGRRSSEWVYDEEDVSLEFYNFTRDLSLVDQNRVVASDAHEVYRRNPQAVLRAYQCALEDPELYIVVTGNNYRSGSLELGHGNELWRLSRTPAAHYRYVGGCKQHEERMAWRECFRTLGSLSGD